MTLDELPAGAAGVIATCAPLTEVFAAAGRRLYLVGGIVRDLIDAGVHDDLDLDFTTDATPAEVKEAVGPVVEAMWTQGERFGTIAAKLEGRLVEITTHRAEAYDPESRKPSVVFSDDVLVDLSRRDFTINAMAIELTSELPRLIDPFGGVGHLHARVLRTPLAPAESFADDPLRMLRAARFVARLGLVPDPGLVDAMASMSDRLAVVSAERIRDELDKLLSVTQDPTPGLTLLVSTGLASRFLPELTHDNVADVQLVPAVPAVRLALVLSGGGPAAARRRLRAMRSSRHDIERVATLVELAGTVSAHTGAWSAADARRLAHRAGEHLADLLDLLVATEGEVTASTLRAAVAALAEAGDLDDLLPALTGDEVMSLLGLGPGPDVGAALEFLWAIRLDDGPMTRESAMERLEEWWGARTEAD